jgi:hypothetical protein
MESNQEPIPPEVKERGQKMALEIVKDVDRSMRLEGQGIPWEDSLKQAKKLAEDLIRERDPRVWGPKP